MTLFGWISITFAVLSINELHNQFSYRMLKVESGEVIIVSLG